MTDKALRELASLICAVLAGCAFGSWQDSWGAGFFMFCLFDLIQTFRD